MIEQLQSDLVQADVVTEVGHVAPVRFQLEEVGAVAQPYSLPPWTPEACSANIPAIQWLRGEFFGFPFGVTEGVEHVHGPAANGPWEITGRSADWLQLEVELPNSAGRIEKEVALRSGHRALYLQHTVRGVEGDFNYGHHPVLHIPTGETAQLRTSVFKFASVYPGVFGKPEDGETCLLQSGATFDSLEAVPLAAGGSISLAEYPTPHRHEDLVMLSAADDVRLGWTAISYPSYVWIAVRSTAAFPSTLFWISNAGRTQPPWNGQHERRIGVEDVCSYFHEGAHISRNDLLADRGISTSKHFRAGQPTVLRHIQCVCPTAGTKAVSAIEPVDGRQAIAVSFEDGTVADIDLDWQWLVEQDTA